MSTTSSRENLLLPPAARLLHVGVPKSGTTSLQSAFHTGRTDLGKRGVVYLGGPDHKPAHAVTGAGILRGATRPSMKDWDGLVAAVRAAGDSRVVVSSEIFAHADDDAARKIATDLRDAGGPLHVVVTLRPLYKVASSQWQQYVQNRISASYLEWLDAMFRRPPYEKPTPSFWRRHDQGGIVQRWADRVGPENVTVVVVDETDRGMLMRTFESLVGLPDGVLVPQSSAQNRSLTVGEAELVRRLNLGFKDKKWADAAYATFVRQGAVLRMKVGRKPGPEEPKLPLPGWAAERVAEKVAKDAEVITSLGVNVVGDLAALSVLPSPEAVDEEAIANPSVPVEVAAEATLGAIEAGVKVAKRAQKLERDLAVSAQRVAELEEQVARLTKEAGSMESFRAAELAGEVARRARRRVAGH